MHDHGFKLDSLPLHVEPSLASVYPALHCGGGRVVVGACVVGGCVVGCVVGGGVEIASQDLSSEPRVKPVLQLHVNDPSVSVQVWSQPPFPDEHSLISANQNETLT